MALFLNIAISFLMGCLTAYFASQRQRNPAKWFVVGLFLGLIGIIILFILPIGKEEDKRRSIPAEVSPLPDRLGSRTEISREENFLQEWFYLDKKHQQHGPVTVLELHKLDQQDALSVDGLVWKKGMDAWKRKAEIAEITLNR